MARRGAARATSAADAPPVAFRKSTAREYLEAIILAVILALFVRTCSSAR